MKSLQIFDEEIVTVCFAVTSILWDKPMVIGASILDLSKIFMIVVQIYDTGIGGIIRTGIIGLRINPMIPM